MIDQAIADIPGKPMALNELARLMKADYEKLTSVVKASGMTAQVRRRSSRAESFAVA